MGMPSVSITFTEVAATAIKRGERGIIAMILRDSVAENKAYECTSNEDIPKTLSESNQKQIELALMGYVNMPKKVIAYVIANEAADYADAIKYLKTIKFNYLVVPTADTDDKKNDIVSFIKSQRSNGNLVKAVLPNVKGDSEGIINYTTEKVYENDKEYTTEQYCSRIAGIIAGTPLSISCTYAPLMELTDCTRLTRDEMDKAVDTGEFIVWHDGEKVKTARGVNSLTTTTDTKNNQFKKIKIVETMDMISDDIRKTAEDSYLGKYANTYDNKCLLLAAIGNYFDQLIIDNVISSASIEIDTEANKSYLKSKGKDVESMSEDEIKRANTGSNVYLRAEIKILDAIEDIVLPIAI